MTWEKFPHFPVFFWEGQYPETIIDVQNVDTTMIFTFSRDFKTLVATLVMAQAFVEYLPMYLKSQNI